MVLLPLQRRGRPRKDDRLVLEGILWIMRTGAPWRDLPPEFGRWKTIHWRLHHWTEIGVWKKIWDTLEKKSDHELHIIDSTSAKVHQHAMGAWKGKLFNRIGKTQGGWTTRIHVVVDSKGRPIKIKTAEGNRNDNLFAKRLLNGKRAHYVLADKAYDTIDIRKFIKNREKIPVIPKQARYGRKVVQTYDKAIYKYRRLVEQFFQRIKTWRSIATCYCKINAIYEGMVIIACMMFWLAY